MAEAALWENYFELQERAIIPYNHVVLLHWGIFQISSDNSNKKIYDQKLTFPNTEHVYEGLHDRSYAEPCLLISTPWKA